jgi:uncharacterized protein
MNRWIVKLCAFGLALTLAIVMPVSLPQKQTSLLSVQATQGDALPDHDNDGIDDFTDIMLGALVEAQAHPDYVSAYYSIYSPGMENFQSIYFDFEYPGGYPPDTEGVCTDTIWRALMAAGYNLKDLMDADIKANPRAYPLITERDPNIDFRRTRNQKIFFDRYLMKVTTNLYDLEAWQPGDIVVFAEDFSHIGIVSNQKNFMGIPYLIHNAGQANRVEDILVYSNYGAKITGHYRWILSTTPNP